MDARFQIALSLGASTIVVYRIRRSTASYNQCRDAKDIDGGLQREEGTKNYVRIGTI